MNFSTYAEKARRTANFPSQTVAWAYCAMQLTAEIREYLENPCIEEAGDVWWFIAVLLGVCVYSETGDYAGIQQYNDAMITVDERDPMQLVNHMPLVLENAVQLQAKIAKALLKGENPNSQIVIDYLRVIAPLFSTLCLSQWELHQVWARNIEKLLIRYPNSAANSNGYFVWAKKR